MRYLFLVFILLAGCRVIEEPRREPPRREVIIEQPAPPPVIVEERHPPVVIERPRPVIIVPGIEIGGHRGLISSAEYRGPEYHR